MIPCFSRNHSRIATTKLILRRVSSNVETPWLLTCE